MTYEEREAHRAIILYWQNYIRENVGKVGYVSIPILDATRVLAWAISGLDLTEEIMGDKR